MTNIHPLMKSEGLKPRKGKVKLCKQCGGEYYRRPSEVSDPFCSFPCYTEWQRRTRIEKECLNCGKEFKLAPSRLKYEGAKYCTLKCSNQYHTRLANKKGDKIPSLETAKKRQIAKRRGSKRTLDNLFSLIIRARDGKCLRCGKLENLQCSHTIPRTHMALRYDMDNCITLCVGCHIYWWHKNPLEAAQWFESMWPGRYEQLRLRAQVVTKLDTEAKLEELKEIHTKVLDSL